MSFLSSCQIVSMPSLLKTAIQKNWISRECNNTSSQYYMCTGMGRSELQKARVCRNVPEQKFDGRRKDDWPEGKWPIAFGKAFPHWKELEFAILLEAMLLSYMLVSCLILGSYRLYCSFYPHIYSLQILVPPYGYHTSWLFIPLF